PIQKCVKFVLFATTIIPFPLPILFQVAVSVVEEFALDGVVYLELRTTLRPVPTCRDYLHTVIQSLTSAPSVLNELIVVRLLVSIDRARGVEEAQKAVALAIEAAHSNPDLVVGVDLSGNPNVGSLLDYVPMLNEARAHGLKTTVHLAEVPDQSSEWLAFLRSHVPDRLGHVTFLTQRDTTNAGTDTDAARKIVLAAKTPLGRYVLPFFEVHVFVLKTYFSA
ncbi:unnamed protein product, partial [Echinostoma caproni]|uniref:A_deaminase domain-containing protein n=1 Tax=Echinostoma caproni TaxID=27848 RepID=A0A183AJP7_9TREM